MALLLIPAFNKGCILTPESCTRPEIQSIILAIKCYEDTFGELPWLKDNNDIIFGEHNVAEYDTLFELLSCENAPDTGRGHVKNSRNIRFIDTRSDYPRNGFVDRWGNRFKILLDTNYDGKVLLGNEILEGSVFVYSYGKNRKDDKGQKDDICSWKLEKYVHK